MQTHLQNWRQSRRALARDLAQSSAPAGPDLSKAAGTTADAQGLQLSASLPGPGGHSLVSRLWKSLGGPKSPFLQDSITIIAPIHQSSCFPGAGSCPALGSQLGGFTASPAKVIIAVLGGGSMLYIPSVTASFSLLTPLLRGEECSLREGN